MYHSLLPIDAFLFMLDDILCKGPPGLCGGVVYTNGGPRSNAVSKVGRGSAASVGDFPESPCSCRAYSVVYFIGTVVEQQVRDPRRMTIQLRIHGRYVGQPCLN